MKTINDGCIDYFPIYNLEVLIFAFKYTLNVFFIFYITIGENIISIIICTRIIIICEISFLIIAVEQRPYVSFYTRFHWIYHPLLP